MSAGSLLTFQRCCWIFGFIVTGKVSGVLTLTFNMTGGVVVPPSVIKPFLNSFVDKLTEQRRNGKPRLTDRLTK
jgi:hypothetical protein